MDIYCLDCENINILIRNYFFVFSLVYQRSAFGGASEVLVAEESFQVGKALLHVLDGELLVEEKPGDRGERRLERLGL